MGSCQNYGPLLGTLNIRGRIITGIQKGTIILTTYHMIASTLPITSPHQLHTVLPQELGFLEEPALL